jgi:hypothetical protein
VEINMAPSEWLTRILEFRLDPEETTRWSEGTVWTEAAADHRLKWRYPAKKLKPLWTRWVI